MYLIYDDIIITHQQYIFSLKLIHIRYIDNLQFNLIFYLYKKILNYK